MTGRGGLSAASLLRDKKTGNKTNYMEHIGYFLIGKSKVVHVMAFVYSS